MDRTERFYKIQTMLMAQPSVTMRQMLETLEVSRATLNRDLAYMRDRLGIPVRLECKSTWLCADATA
jgi:predicted DNA-binding transcriptional regulator YafY